MDKFRIRMIKEKKLIWTKVRWYIDFVILVCCSIIAFNIHPLSIAQNADDKNLSKMVYIFHDFYWNEYIMNENIHWAADSWDYLFDDEIPDSLKNEHNSSVKLPDLDSQWNIKNENSDNNTVKDNQVSLGDVLNDLWMDSENALLIEVSDTNPNSDENNSYYNVKEETWENEDSTLIIEKIDSESEPEDSLLDKETDDDLLVAKVFTFVNEWWIIPILTPWDDLYFWESNQVVGYINNTNNWTETSKSGITIIDDYADCMTPRWYKIMHWDSVLAYQQIEDTPDICNIERRFCRKWKLSGTYTQQWCSINKNYTYEQWWQSETVKSSGQSKWGESKWNSKQDSNESVNVYDSEIWWSFVFDKPGTTHTDYYSVDNVRSEDEEVDQTSRPLWDCTAPWWEKINHGQFIQAFKHANWFSDAPCEAQLRLCSMGELMWSYTQSTCKTRDTSFIDWVNGSPTWDTYSKEKLDLIRKQIKNEEKYYKNERKKVDRSTDSEALDRILLILDK